MGLLRIAAVQPYLESGTLAACLRNVYDAHIISLKVYGVNMNVPNLSKKSQYHHGNLREALVEAGLKQLAAGSHGEPSLRELARQVGVTVNAAYRHFANKEAVMAAMAAEGFRRFDQAQALAITGQMDSQQTMLALGRAYIQFAQDNPALFRLMFGRFEQGCGDAELEAASGAAFNNLRAAVARTAGLEPDNPDLLAMSVHVWGLVHGLSHLLLDGRLQAFSDDPDALVEAALGVMAKVPV